MNNFFDARIESWLDSDGLFVRAIEQAWGTITTVATRAVLATAIVAGASGYVFLQEDLCLRAQSQWITVQGSPASSVPDSVENSFIGFERALQNLVAMNVSAISSANMQRAEGAIAAMKAREGQPVAEWADRLLASVPANG